MGMVARTNVMAINANRSLGINNSQVSKNLEKLSSGFRSNRAADDSAGLAISEKMKAQIKSTVNSKADGTVSGTATDNIAISLKTDPAGVAGSGGLSLQNRLEHTINNLDVAAVHPAAPPVKYIKKVAHRAAFFMPSTGGIQSQTFFSLI